MQGTIRVPVHLKKYKYQYRCNHVFYFLRSTAPQCFRVGTPGQSLPWSQEDSCHHEIVLLGHFGKINVDLVSEQACVAVSKILEGGLEELYADPAEILFRQLLFPESLGVSWKHRIWNVTGPPLNLDFYSLSLWPWRSLFKGAPWIQRPILYGKTCPRWRGAHGVQWCVKECSLYMGLIVEQRRGGEQADK